MVDFISRIASIISEIGSEIGSAVVGTAGDLSLRNEIK
jgi:hypothetical protein